MVKYFCDICGAEMSDQDRGRIKIKRGRVSLEIMTALDNVWNNGQVCHSCIVDVVFAYGERSPATGVNVHTHHTCGEWMYTCDAPPVEADEYERMKARAEAAEAKLAAATKQASLNEEDELTLSNLQEDTNDVLDSLDKTLVKGAINWADLRCVSVEKVHDKRGREWYRVEIEEAAPGEEALIAAVAAGLSTKGWYMADIEITTEW